MKTFVYTFINSIFVIFITLCVQAKEVDPRAEAFGARPEIKNVKISPDGSKLLMLSLHEGSYILLTKSLLDANIAPSGIPVTGGEYLWADWATNERIVAGVTNDEYTNSRDNRELYSHMVSLDWTGENYINLSKKRGRNSWIDLDQAIVYNWLPKEPNHILFNMIGDIFKVNILTNEFKLIYEGNLKQGSYYFNDKGELQYIVGREQTSGNIHSDQYRETEDSEWVDVFTIDRHAENNPLYFEGLSLDPGIIFLSNYDKNGALTLFQYNVNTKQIVSEVAVSHDKAGITSYNIKEGSLYSYNFYNGRENTIYLGAIEQKVQKIMQSSFTNSNYRIIDETNDKDKFILFISSPTEPGSYYLLDLNSNKLEMLGYIYQKVDPEELNETEIFKFAARDGVELQGFITFPKGKKENSPTVVMVHPGPNNRAQWEFDPMIQFITSNGYAVMQINYRGSTGYGKTFVDLAKEEWAGKIIEDINDATKWMIDQGFADSNNVCIYGEEYGGYAALMATIKDENRYNCVAVSTPLIDVYLANPSMHHRGLQEFYTRKKYRNFRKKDVWSFKDVSIVTNIDNIKVPVFAIDQYNNYVSGWAHFNKFKRLMTDEKKDFSSVDYAQSDCLVGCNNVFKDSLVQLNSFFGKHLKN